MNRRSFFQAAALTTVAAIKGGASPSSNDAGVPAPENGTQKPTEVNLSSLKEPGCRSDPGIDLFVYLESLYAADPGEFTGVTLRLQFAGSHLMLKAEFAGIAEGQQTLHCLGHLWVDEVIQLVESAANYESYLLSLHEFYSNRGYSGLRLEYLAVGKPQLQCVSGAHCLGVLRGRMLTEFIECARLRINTDPGIWA